MEDIGCHFKFENFSGNCFHNTNLLLSSGRNCLRYIINERDITTLFLPYFLCESLSDVSNAEGINVVYYHIDDNMLPANIDKSQLNEHSFLYFVNYYGLLRKNIDAIIDEYKFVIIDNTHDFFDKDIHNADVIYNYRKYFGVPDGACIVSPNLKYNNKYNLGNSLNKIIEMVSRDETGEFFHYPTFADADKFFREEELCYMSNFTNNYLKSIDYLQALKQRLKNYSYLQNALKNRNLLDLSQQELTFMYPLMCEDGIELRNYLQSNNIYAQFLWPNIQWNGACNQEIIKANQIVLLPIDQRYSEIEMRYIAETVDSYKKVYKKL